MSTPPAPTATKFWANTDVVWSTLDNLDGFQLQEAAGINKVSYDFTLKVLWGDVDFMKWVHHVPKLASRHEDDPSNTTLVIEKEETGRFVRTFYDDLFFTQKPTQAEWAHALTLSAHAKTLNFGTEEGWDYSSTDTSTRFFPTLVGSLPDGAQLFSEIVNLNVRVYPGLADSLLFLNHVVRGTSGLLTLSLHIPGTQLLSCPEVIALSREFLLEVAQSCHQLRDLTVTLSGKAYKSVYDPLVSAAVAAVGKLRELKIFKVSHLTRGTAPRDDILRCWSHLKELHLMDSEVSALSQCVADAPGYHLYLERIIIDGILEADKMDAAIAFDNFFTSAPSILPRVEYIQLVGLEYNYSFPENAVQMLQRLSSLFHLKEIEIDSNFFALTWDMLKEVESKLPGVSFLARGVGWGSKMPLPAIAQGWGGGDMPPIW